MPRKPYPLLTCAACRGTGVDPLGRRHPPCGGTGKVYVKIPPNPPILCSSCRGTGYTATGKMCPACKGTGWMNGIPMPR